MLGLNKEEVEEVKFGLELGLEAMVDLNVHGFHERN